MDGSLLLPWRLYRKGVKPVGKKSRKGQKLTNKQRTQIWCEITKSIAPTLWALAALLAVLIRSG